MSVTVEVVGGETREVAVDEGTTYADLVRAVDLRVEAASVLVDGSPVPADRPVEAERVRVLRLVRGG